MARAFIGERLRGIVQLKFILAALLDAWAEMAVAAIKNPPAMPAGLVPMSAS